MEAHTMKKIVIELNDYIARRLNDLSKEHDMTPEEAVKNVITNLVMKLDTEEERLNKNA